MEFDTDSNNTHDYDIPLPESSYISLSTIEDDSIIFPEVDTLSIIHSINKLHENTPPPKHIRQTTSNTILQMLKHIEIAKQYADILNIPLPTFKRNPHDQKFHCSVCTKNFRSCSDLISHFRIHTNEKPHKCNLCNSNFAHISNLRAHERSIHGIITRRYNITGKKRSRS